MTVETVLQRMLAAREEEIEKLRGECEVLAKDKWEVEAERDELRREVERLRGERDDARRSMDSLGGLDREKADRLHNARAALNREGDDG